MMMVARMVENLDQFICLDREASEAIDMSL